MEKKYIVIRDQSGQLIMGGLTGETPESVNIHNPACLFIQPSPEGNGKLVVQIFELFLRDLTQKSSHAHGTSWEFFKSGISVARDIECGDNLIQRYEQIFNVAPTKQPTTPPKGNVVSLFDD